MIRGRFAPTPSGQMHIGNAYTALLSWLQVRRTGGAFVLRMEDIDRPRCRSELASLILTDLRWLSLDWDEGPDVGGPHDPYVQSKREAAYQAAIEQLRETDWLYPCWCSRSEIMAVASAPHGLSEEGPCYPGTCRHLTLEQAEARASRGKRPSLRFALPDEPVTFEDAILGPQFFSAGAGGDFVVRRADDLFAYQLAVVVDDAAMQITDVLRGADLLDSTPRQILLYRALGLTPPTFAHVPLLMAPDGRRLSKRDGAVTLSAMRAAGMAPEEIVGQLAFLSGLIDRPEPIRPVDLIAHFDCRKIPQRPVVVRAGCLGIG